MSGAPGPHNPRETLRELSSLELLTSPRRPAQRPLTPRDHVHRHLPAAASCVVIIQRHVVPCACAAAERSPGWPETPNHPVPNHVQPLSPTPHRDAEGDVERTRPGTAHLERASLSLIGVLAVATALRAALAYHDHSVFWPDEIHQSLEQAHRAAFGYGLVPWEFRDGARSWLFPGIIAGIWKVTAGVGVESSLTLVFLARLLMVSASIAAMWFAAQLATKASGPIAGAAVAVIMATFPPSVVFSYRAMSETASAPFIALGAWFLFRRIKPAASLAGLAIASACLFRYQNLLFAVVFASGLLLQRRSRDAWTFCSAGVSVALLGGLVDWVTWGRPFHSLIAYVDFNLIIDGASDFGVEPFWYYARALWSSAGPSSLALLGCFAIGMVAEPILAAAVAVYVLAHCVLPHKELRFLVPSFPLFATVAGIGVQRLLARMPKLVGPTAAVAMTAAFGYALVHLSYENMGQYIGTSRASLSVWKTEEEPTLLLAEAGEQADLCGIAVVGARAAFTGAYTYLHRDVPLIYGGELCDPGPVNYVIRSTSPSDAKLLAAYALQSQRGSWGLYRRPGACRPSPKDDDRLLEGARDMGLVRQKAKQERDGSLLFDLERDSGAFVQGWGHGERLACDMARWAVSKKAALEFELSPADRAYQLTLYARAHEAALPQTLSVVINGVTSRVGSMTNQLKGYSIDVREGALREGKNRIELIFRRSGGAADNDSRELTALFRRIELLPKHDDFTIDLARTESRRHLAGGFSAPEQEDSQAFVWSEGPSSEVVGSLARPRSAYVLQILAEALPLTPTQHTRVFANDQPVGHLDVPRQWDVRRLLIPASALHSGENRIRFEYEAPIRPAAVNRRLRDQRPLAVRFRQIELTPVITMSSLDLGTPEARPFLLDGWSGDERDGERNAVWTDGLRASVVLSLARITKPVLRLSAQGYTHALPVAVKVLLNGKLVGAFAAPDGWQDIAVPIPAASYSTAGELITFEFDHTLAPSDRDPQSHDARQLALRVDRIWAEAEGAGDVASSAGAARSNSEVVTIPRGIAVTR
jgi:phosphatidylinositol glycan class B